MARLWLLCIIVGTICSAARAANVDCKEFGFTGEASCSDCDTFAEFVKDDGLVADCKKCCIREPAAKKFTKATLEICQFRVASYPQIKDFIDKKAKSFSNLKVSYPAGASPKLRLAGGPDGASETLRIDNWKSSAIDEFLKERLEVKKA